MSSEGRTRQVQRLPPVGPVWRVVATVARGRFKFLIQISATSRDRFSPPQRLPAWLRRRSRAPGPTAEGRGHQLQRLPPLGQCGGRFRR